MDKSAQDAEYIDLYFTYRQPDTEQSSAIIMLKDNELTIEVSEETAAGHQTCKTTMTRDIATHLCDCLFKALS